MHTGTLAHAPAEHMPIEPSQDAAEERTFGHAFAQFAHSHAAILSAQGGAVDPHAHTHAHPHAHVHGHAHAEPRVKPEVIRVGFDEPVPAPEVVSDPVESAAETAALLDPASAVHHDAAPAQPEAQPTIGALTEAALDGTHADATTDAADSLPNTTELPSQHSSEEAQTTGSAAEASVEQASFDASDSTAASAAIIEDTRGHIDTMEAGSAPQDVLHNEHIGDPISEDEVAASRLPFAASTLPGVIDVSVKDVQAALHEAVPAHHAEPEASVDEMHMVHVDVADGGADDMFANNTEIVDADSHHAHGHDFAQVHDAVAVEPANATDSDMVTVSVDAFGMPQHTRDTHRWEHDASSVMNSLHELEHDHSVSADSIEVGGPPQDTTAAEIDRVEATHVATGPTPGGLRCRPGLDVDDASLVRWMTAVLELMEASLLGVAWIVRAGWRALEPARGAIEPLTSTVSDAATSVWTTTLEPSFRKQSTLYADIVSGALNSVHEDARMAPALGTLYSVYDEAVATVATAVPAHAAFAGLIVGASMSALLTCVSAVVALQLVLPCIAFVFCCGFARQKRQPTDAESRDASATPGPHRTLDSGTLQPTELAALGLQRHYSVPAPDGDIAPDMAEFLAGADDDAMPASARGAAGSPTIPTLHTPSHASTSHARRTSAQPGAPPAAATSADGQASASPANVYQPFIPGKRASAATTRPKAPSGYAASGISTTPANASQGPPMMDVHMGNARRPSVSGDAPALGSNEFVVPGLSMSAVSAPQTVAGPGGTALSGRPPLPEHALSKTSRPGGRSRSGAPTRSRHRSRDASHAGEERRREYISGAGSFVAPSVSQVRYRLVKIDGKLHKVPVTAEPGTAAWQEASSVSHPGLHTVTQSAPASATTTPWRMSSSAHFDASHTFGGSSLSTSQLHDDARAAASDEVQVPAHVHDTAAAAADTYGDATQHANQWNGPEAASAAPDYGAQEHADQWNGTEAAVAGDAGQWGGLETTVASPSNRASDVTATGVHQHEDLVDNMDTSAVAQWPQQPHAYATADVTTATVQDTQVDTSTPPVTTVNTGASSFFAASTEGANEHAESAPDSIDAPEPSPYSSSEGVTGEGPPAEGLQNSASVHEGVGDGVVQAVSESVSESAHDQQAESVPWEGGAHTGAGASAEEGAPTDAAASQQAAGEFTWTPEFIQAVQPFYDQLATYAPHYGYNLDEWQQQLSPEDFQNACWQLAAQIYQQYVQEQWQQQTDATGTGTDEQPIQPAPADSLSDGYDQGGVEGNYAWEQQQGPSAAYANEYASMDAGSMVATESADAHHHHLPDAAVSSM